MAYQPLTMQRGNTRASAISGAADELLQRRVAGDSPALRARFQGMNEATANAARTNRAANYQGAVRAGTGLQSSALRRAGQSAADQSMAQLSGNQLQQNQIAAEDQDAAMRAGISRGASERAEQFQNLQAAQANAAAMGDTTTQAALGDLYLGGANQQYTDVGRERISDEAQAAREEANWLRSQQDKYTGEGPSASSSPWWKRTLKGGTAGAATGSMFGPYGTAIGGGVGALAGLFS